MHRLKDVSVRLLRHASIAWSLTGVTLLLLVGLNVLAEAVLRLHGSVVNFEFPRQEIGRRVPRPFSADFDRVWLRWQPFVYWRAAPMSGQCINVGPDGLRRTWGQKPEAVKKPSIRIFLFGGSAMFGFGVCDDSTIPSQLAKALAAHGVQNVEVLNFGQLGYVSTQEVLTLLSEVRRGDSPDLAIFYDGFNDAASAYQNGGTGITINEANRVREFNSLNTHLDDPWHVVVPLVADWLELTPAVRITRATLRRLGVSMRTAPFHTDPAWTVSFLGVREAALADRVVSTYLTDATGLTGASKAIGLNTLFYWQPVLLETMSPPALRRFVVETYNAAAAAGGKNQSGVTFTDLSAALRGEGDGCYVDGVHLTGKCNAVIAAIMAKDVKRVLMTRDYRLPIINAE